MKILNFLIVTPSLPSNLSGNGITAFRWSRIIKNLGHRVSIAERFYGQECDVMIALHALKSHKSMKNFKTNQKKNQTLILALTGTDLYRDIQKSEPAKESLNLANFLIAIQKKALEELEDRIKVKTRVIYQSSEKPTQRYKKDSESYQICVIGHLREVKDPFVTAQASRLMPSYSKVKVIHVGEALSEEMKEKAIEEMRLNPRYSWKGKLDPIQTKKLLGESWLMVLSSLMEGGANVISEALMHHVPVLASRVSGNIGMLGENYSGYFSVSKVQELQKLILRCEEDSMFYHKLKESCLKERPKFFPKVEAGSWNNLIEEIIGRGFSSA